MLQHISIANNDTHTYYAQVDLEDLPNLED